MNNVFIIFLSLSFSGSLMILAMLLCKHVWKDRLSRQWQYYIWLVVIARLLLPFASEPNLTGNIFQTVGHAPQQQQELAPSMEDRSSLHMEQNGQVKSIALLVNNLWLIWLIIAFGLLIRKITLYQSFVRYVKAGQTYVSDTKLLDLLSVLTEQAGMKQPVELCVNPLISSPLLIGFFRPCIVLPGTDISEKDFRYTVLHELTHHLRRDMFYKWLVQATVCLHWFNPLVAVMSREINRACEFSCDEAMIAKLDSSSAQEYGKTLLDTMVKAGSYKEALASVTLNSNKEMLKERLGAIMNFKKKSRLNTACSTMLTAIFLCMATVTGAYAAANPDTVDANTDTAAVGTVVINLSNNNGQTNLIHSSSFEASDGQVLTLETKSTIKGTVNLVLFSPSYQEQRITFGGSNDTVTVNLSEGTWAYNCTGFFDSGDISITGTVQ